MRRERNGPRASTLRAFSPSRTSARARAALRRRAAAAVPRAARGRPPRRSACRRRWCSASARAARAAADALRDVPQRREDRRQRLAARERRVRRGGCETGRRCRSGRGRPGRPSPSAFAASPPMRRGEPRRFGQPARDQRGARVLAERKPVARAGRDREHVLDRPARLDAREVGAVVRAERRAAKRARPARARTRRRSTRRRAPSATPARLPRRSSAPRRRPPAPATAARAPGARARRPPAAPARRRSPSTATRAARARRPRRADRRRRSARPPVSRRSAWRRPLPTARSDVTVSASGQGDAGQIARVLARRTRSSAACAGSRAHSATRMRGARWTASAVPQAPAPNSATSKAMVAGRIARALGRRSVLRARTPGRRARSPIWPSRCRTFTQPGFAVALADAAGSASSSSTFCSARKTTGAASSAALRTSAAPARTTSIRLSASALFGDPADRARACRAPSSSLRR